ncbi:MAG TPA: hypothetical protein PKW65_09905 [Bacteroidia bacterium]|nr:hypothetical protein [Bacteroidia bacterium]
MNRFKNILINGKHGKPVVADMFFNGNKDPMPVIIFLTCPPLQLA